MPLKCNLKIKNRIATLAMIMVLCLMAYSITERQFRNILREMNISIRIQIDKATQRPMAKWVYILFSRVRQIDEITDSHIVSQILNTNDELCEIARLPDTNIKK